LDGLPDFVQKTLAGWLEKEALKIIDANALGDVVDENTVIERFHAIRQKALKDYELCKTIARRAIEEDKPTSHYISLYHQHGFS
jgi:hypothetical protein